MLDIWRGVVNNTVPVIHYCCDDFQWLSIHTSFNENELFGIEDVKEGTYWYMSNQNFAVYSGNRFKSEVHSACVLPSKRPVMKLWWIRIRIEWQSPVNLWQPRLASSLETDDNSLPTNSPWCNQNRCRKVLYLQKLCNSMTDPHNTTLKI